MKKSVFVLAFICILFSGCKKENTEVPLEEKEDLSYKYRTYCRQESITGNNYVIEERWTYDGYKETSYKYYYNGQLRQERKTIYMMG